MAVEFVYGQLVGLQRMCLKVVYPLAQTPSVCVCVGDAFERRVSC